QLSFGLCNQTYTTETYQGCLDKGANTIGKPILLLTLAFLVVTPFLFFVRDEIFKKWLWFALAWFIVSGVLIALAPQYVYSFLPLYAITKATVTYWSSVLFVPLSLGLLLWLSRKRATA
ncbi:MAG TPA: hypothetical protein VN420_01315, partial [Candidatus Fimivivens sp.]|nr:hypothetical protein [Candidatus Fimivivens sp.]